MGEGMANGKGLIGWNADTWQRLLHDARSGPESWLGMAEAKLAEEAVGALLPTLPDDAGEQELETLNAVAEACAKMLGRGVYGHLEGDPERIHQGPAWADAVAEAIAKTPGIEDARSSVAGDPDCCAIAASALMRAAAREVPKIIEELQQQGLNPGQGMGGPGQGQPGADGQPSGEGGEGEGEGQAQQPSLEELQAAIEAAAKRSAQRLRPAVQKALDEVAEGRSLLNGVLPGLGEAPARHEQESTGRLALIERLKKDERLRRVLMIAGRIRRIAERVQKQRCEHITQEVVDIERGADLGRILPSEMVGLTVEDDEDIAILEDLFYAKFAERGLGQYKMTGEEPLGKGAIAALLDISGSMATPLNDGLRRIDWASAIGVAALRAGVEQRRKVVVLAFNGYVARQWVVEIGDREGAKRAILEVACLGCDGGTDFSPAIGRALDLGAEADRSDIILVTDGFGGVSDPVQKRLAEARTRGLRCWGVIAGEGGMPDALAAFTDGVAVLDGSCDAAERIGLLGAT